MIREQKRNSESGYSLVEVIVAISMFVIIVVAALMIYDRSNRQFKQGMESSNLQQGSRVAFEKLMSDLRMAGFDFDRDGIPTLAAQYQQPDEQIEYVSTSAITFRGNFNFDTETTPCPADTTTGTPPAKCGNGREVAYEPEDKEFPLVTTANDEIVTYALVSRDASANDDTIEFFADVSKPRSAFPGGSAETRVQIDGVDLSNAHPPYTLQRITLDDEGRLVRTALADNIRSLTFQYYEDSTGRQLLTNLEDPPAVYAAADLATSVGGIGPYDPDNPTAVLPERTIRGKIRSVRVTLVGMNEQPDPNYTDVTDTIAPHYRKYRLESLVVPRNAGRRGALEQETRPPGQPTITRVCIGYCGLAYIEWQAAVGGGNIGAADQYAVLSSSDGGATYPNIEYVGNVLSAYISLPDPASSYKFKVEAINSFGAALSAENSGGAMSGINQTTPNPPQSIEASGGGGSMAAVANRVDVRWTAPTTNASGAPSCSSGTPPSSAPFAEIAGWEIQRSSASDPSWRTIVDTTTTGSLAPAFNSYTGAVTWSDTTAANCETYTYRIRTVERCTLSTQNASGINHYSAWVTVTGAAASDQAPSIPTAPVATGTCPPSSGTTCSISLTWPAVNTDASGRPITVAQYTLNRTRKNVSGYTETLSAVQVTTANGTWTPNPVQPTSITYVDAPTYAPASDPSATNGPYYFEYTVTASQCANTSDPSSPPTKFPCAFGAGTPTVTVTGATVVEGDGSAADPWVLTEGGDLSVSTSGARRLSALTATFVPASGSSSVIRNVDSGATFTSDTFDLPNVATNEAYSIILTLRDSEGCQWSRTYYFREAGSNCCIVPRSLDATLVLIDDSTDTVKYRLINSCSDPLTIEGVTINWNSSYENGANLRVRFPTSQGQNPPTNDSSQANASPATLSSPSGSYVTLNTDATGTSDDYYIVVRFSKNFGTTSPISSLCVRYRVGTDTTLHTCRIDPEPASTVDTCP